MTGFLSKSPEFDADSVTRVTRRGHDLTIDPESFVSGSTPAVSTGGVQRHVRVAVMQPWLFNTDVPTDMRLRWSLLPASSADGTMSLSMHYVILHNNLSRHTISTLSSTTLHRVSHEFVHLSPDAWMRKNRITAPRVIFTWSKVHWTRILGRNMTAEGFDYWGYMDADTILGQSALLRLIDVLKSSDHPVDVISAGIGKLFEPVFLMGWFTLFSARIDWGEMLRNSAPHEFNIPCKDKCSGFAYDEGLASYHVIHGAKGRSVIWIPFLIHHGWYPTRLHPSSTTTATLRTVVLWRQLNDSLIMFVTDKPMDDITAGDVVGMHSELSEATPITLANSRDMGTLDLDESNHRCMPWIRQDNLATCCSKISKNDTRDWKNAVVVQRHVTGESTLSYQQINSVAPWARYGEFYVMDVPLLHLHNWWRPAFATVASDAVPTGHAYVVEREKHGAPVSDHMRDLVVNI